MDHMFHLKQDMTNEELQRFAQDRMQQEKNVNDYMLQREQRAQMSLAQLVGKPQTGQVAEKPIAADMPTLAADEKDWKRKKKQKQKMQPQARALQNQAQEIQKKFDARAVSIQNEQKLDAQSRAMFTETLRADMFTPKYVMEHFADVRYILYTWKRHIELFEEGGEANNLLAEDQKLRLVHMKEMYEQGEKAFHAALGAMGFRYHPEMEEKKQFEELPKEQQEQALEDNKALRSAIAKGAAEMDKAVADELIEKEIQHHKPEILAFRESVRQKYPFIESENMTHDYEYDETAKIKQLFEQHPAEYEQNKEVLDKLYREFFNLMEYNGTCYEISRTIGLIQFDEKIVSSDKMQRLVNLQLEQQEGKMSRIRARAVAIMDGVRHIVLGKELPESSYFTLKDFIPLQYSFTPEALAVREQAAAYTVGSERKKATFERIAEQLYGERAEELTAGENGKYMLFMEKDKPEHNETVVRTLLELRVAETMQRSGGKDAEHGAKDIGRIMKPLVLPYLERMRDYDTRDLGHCTPEELMEKNEELQELALIGMQIAEAAKYRDPDDADGRSIRDVFCAGQKELFTMKCSVIAAYAKKARGLCMVKAYQRGSLDESCFTTEELKEMRSKGKLQSTDHLTMEQMLQCAREMVEKADAAQAVAYQTYLRTDSIKESYTGPVYVKNQTTHPKYQKERMEAYEEGRRILKESGNLLNIEQLQEYYELCGKKIQELKKELEAQEEPGKRDLELRKEIEKLEKYREYTRIEYTLTGKDYVRTGDENSLLREPIFRTYDSVESQPAFQNMSDEDFAVMCKKLAAGTFAEDKENPERFETYYAENMEGLRMYKQRMSEHYEMLESVFHHRIPSVEYIQENRLRLERWFANTQVDNHMIEGMRDLLDLTNPADLRLYHLVVTYNGICGYVASISTMISLGGLDYKEADMAVSLPFMAAAESIKYLEQEDVPVQKDRETLEAELAELETQKDTYADKKEWLKKKEAAQSPLMIEKFRQLGEDALHIWQEDEKTQITYLVRVKELEDYIQSYGEVQSLNMEQFKGWLYMAKIRIPFVLKSLYYSKGQESDHVTVLDSENILRKEMESGDAQRVLDAALEVNKMHMLFTSTDYDSDRRRELEKNSTWAKCHELETKFWSEKIENMPEEFQQKFIQVYYQKKETLMNRVNEAVADIMQKLPEQLEDKEGYAMYLVMQTQLGKEYEALRVMAHTYFRNEPMQMKVVAFTEQNKELIDRTGQMDGKLVNACTKYSSDFQSIGYTSALDKEYLHTFQEQFVEKEAKAKKANPEAGTDSFDILQAQLIAREQAGHDTFQELAQKLSKLHVTEEMLTPEYMTFHAKELFASFEAMDAYSAMVRENPQLEETISDRQRFLWAKNRSFYKKYRNYVMTFARSRCVDTTEGTYLSEEQYQSEKGELTQKLSEEKQEITKVLGGFREYSQKVDEISRKIEGIKKLTKKDKTAVLKPLQECGEWLKDLTRYLAQPLVLSPEDFFDATLMTLMSMFGYIEKDLRETKKALGIANVNVEGALDEINEISGTFMEFKERIPGIAQEFRRKVLEFGEEGEIPLTLRDIVMEAQEIKSFHVEGQQQNVGDGASEVIRLREGDKVFYFKGDETLKSFPESVRELLLTLENEELRQTVGKRFQAILKGGTEIELRNFVEFSNFIREDGSLNQDRFYEWNDPFRVDLRPLILENPENWKRFAKAIFQKYVTADTAETGELLIDEGANMTARNFASERVAELMGQKGIIIRNRDAVIVDENGVQKKGFIMNQAEGAPAAHVGKLADELHYEIHFTAEAQKKLLNLQIIDIITGQIDRHMGNYFLQYDRDDEAKTFTVKGVTGIDNDFAFGRSVEMNSRNTGTIFTLDKKYQYGMIDKEMYEAMMSVSPELLVTNLEGVIEPQYMNALKQRYTLVRQRIREAKEEADKNGGDFFREKGGWNEQSEWILATQEGISESYVKKIKCGEGSWM